MVPDTRESLILRLPDTEDVAAWDEFAAIYEPLIYRLARAKGLQHADAQEVVQEVLLAVSRAVERWKPGEEFGRFRDWLFQISRNLVINQLTRRKHRSIGSGDSKVAALLNGQCAPGPDESQWFDLELRREIFHYAASRVKSQVTDSTWQAFWLSSVEQQPIRAVAARLHMTAGSVYIARSRVMAKLRQLSQAYLHDDGLAARPEAPLYSTPSTEKGKP